MSFQKPINASITQRFGADFEVSPGRLYYRDTLGYSGHNGDDYAAPAGTPVVAADEGTITFEGWGQNHSWMGTPAGICVLLNNGGVYSGYAHLSSTVVSKGQRVAKGQLLGYVGSTGAATGPHLHFEALPLSPNFKNGFAGRIDPQQFMEAPRNLATPDQVREAFLAILERPAEPEAISHYTAYPLDFVRSDLAASQEYRNLVARKEEQARIQRELESQKEQAAREAAQKAEAERIAAAEAARLAAEEAAKKAAEEANGTTQLAILKENNALLQWIVATLKTIFNIK